MGFVLMTTSITSYTPMLFKLSITEASEVHQNRLWTLISRRSTNWKAAAVVGLGADGRGMLLGGMLLGGMLLGGILLGGMLLGGILLGTTVLGFVLGTTG